MGKKEYCYNTETGDVEQIGTEEGGMEPLRIPGVVQHFMRQYLPAENEVSATDVIPLGRLRTLLCAWVGFGVKEDPMQEYLNALASSGYYLQSTSSGPALCVVSRQSGRIIESPYEEIVPLE